MNYEASKLTNRETGARCAVLGIQLIPVVVESFRGWGPRAQHALSVIARAFATRPGTNVGLATTQMYEGLSTIIMRANARALLARTGGDAHGSASDAQSRALSMLHA